MTKKEADSVHYKKSLSVNPPWNHSRAKPKNKSCLLAMGGRIIGRAQAEICDETDWPSLPQRQESTSTPVHESKQDWTTVSGKVSSKPPNQPPKQLSVKLKNRFAPLSENPESPLDHDFGQPSISKQLGKGQTPAKIQTATEKAKGWA